MKTYKLSDSMVTMEIWKKVIKKDMETYKLSDSMVTMEIWKLSGYLNQKAIRQNSNYKTVKTVGLVIISGEIDKVTINKQRRYG